MTESGAAQPPSALMGSVTQANMLPSTSDKPQKPRHRASVACKACRERRTRCVIFPGDSECTQCRSLGCECVINYDDERRKPNSRAYINSLNERIAALEQALQEKDRQSATTAKQSPSTRVQTRPASHSPVLVSTTVPLELDPGLSDGHGHPDAAAVGDSDATDGYSPPSNLSIDVNESMVSKLLSTRGHLSFDQLSGRLRYFGPTTNCHVHSNLHLQSEQTHRQALEQQRRTQRIINTLPIETHDYLMDTFWSDYNSVIHVIHRKAFEECRETGGPFYSGFLHVCILAMGFRTADKSRPDIRNITVAPRESSLHKEAKFMLEYEIEQPAGIPTIAAVLLMGDLECGVGRDNVGWLYAGMANRLCFDIGLHLDRSNAGLSQLEIDIGRMTLMAAVIIDKYWALFLGRPTSLKSSDLETYNLAQQFERLGKSMPAGPQKSYETQIYESLVDLMEIAGKITEIMDQASRLDDHVNLNHHVFVRMANLNRELEIWYTRLAKPLQWTPENVQAAPFSFFLLHQQYHVTMILLHRPFARYGDVQPAHADGNMEDYVPQPNMHLSSMSRTICTQHAVRVARIFWQHRQRFNTKEIFITGLQHAGTAAIALVAALASLKDSSSRDANLHYLETLAAALQDMVETYHPAERMSAVVQAVIVELRATLPQPKQRKIVPARRESTHDHDDDDDDDDHDVSERFKPSKRHQSFRRSSPQRSMSANFIPQQASAPLQPGPPPPINEIDASSSSSTMDRDHHDTSSGRMPTQSALDGFVVVTPHTDALNLEGTWPTLSNPNASALDYPMFTTRTTSTGAGAFGSMPTPGASAWMGAETPAVSPPPSGTSAYMFQSAPFPSSTSRMQDTDALGGNGNNGGVSNLDFLSLLSSDRNDFSGMVGTRDDDFALLPTPTATPITNTAASGMNFGIKPLEKTGDRRCGGLNASSNPMMKQHDGSAARTMAGLDDLWNQMRESNKER